LYRVHLGMTVSGSHKYSGGDYTMNINDQNAQKGEKQHTKNP